MLIRLRIVITNWTVHDNQTGVWTASTPIGVESRHLYANQIHAQRARQEFNRTWILNVTDAYQIVNDSAEFLLSLEGIEHGDFRGIGSFTDRSIPITGLGANKTVTVAQPALANNIIGYDTITDPFFDNGFFIENVLSLLDEPNEYYLNSSIGQVYYIPPAGVSPNDMYMVLPKLEQLLVLAGTYEDPVHDLTFQGLNYMHTTWSQSIVSLCDQADVEQTFLQRTLGMRINRQAVLSVRTLPILFLRRHDHTGG
jgi:hypothetical protein